MLTWSKSLPLGFILGTTCTKVVVGWYAGNGLKSGSCVIPGQASSEGVPN